MSMDTPPSDPPANLAPKVGLNLHSNYLVWLKWRSIRILGYNGYPSIDFKYFTFHFFHYFPQMPPVVLVHFSNESLLKLTQEILLSLLKSNYYYHCYYHHLNPD